jgi:phosphoribosylaminoimidazole-succinocarboxamide synthase
MQTVNQIITTIDLPGLKPIKEGKVRSLYNIDKYLLLVASDRISAFDHIFREGIPSKGAVLTGISLHWFELTESIIANHLITAEVNEFPPSLKPYADILRGRSMLVRKTKVIPIECIVRGYIEGSGWKDYQKTGAICGHRLPTGLKQGDRLPEVLFTPSTKAEEGHDLNISVAQMNDLIGKELGSIIQEKAIAVYTKAAKYALEKGIIIADTKFEFGIDEKGEVILIDEVLTPDSSRFWDIKLYKPGQSQQSFGKQFVRDYLESINWNKEPPIPTLPAEIVRKTSEKYLEAYQRITGTPLV